jgi:hypothetical protein
MATDSKWIDAKWWRDWLFWVGVVVATFALLVRVSTGGGPWWTFLLGWVVTFSVSVAVVGFVRTVVRTYRVPETNRQD